MTLREFRLLIPAVVFQESHVQGFVNVADVTVAADLASVIVTVVYNLHHWEWSQPSWFHILVAIWCIYVL